MTPIGARLLIVGAGVLSCSYRGAAITLPAHGTEERKSLRFFYRTDGLPRLAFAGTFRVLDRPTRSHIYARRRQEPAPVRFYDWYTGSMMGE